MGRKAHEHGTNKKEHVGRPRRASAGEDGKDARIRKLEARVAELEAEREQASTLKAPTRSGSCPRGESPSRSLSEDGAVVDVGLIGDHLGGPHAGRSLALVEDITERKRAEEALRQSEQRYRMLHESLRDSFVQVAMDGQIIDCNDLYCQMLGYSPEEIRSLTYQQVTPERWHAFEERIVRDQIIRRGYSDVYQKEYRRKDGTVFPVELRTIVSRDASGRPNAMWGIVRDITERKRAEEELRRSREEYRHLVEASGSVILRVDKKMRITFVNQHGLRFFGYAPDEILGRRALGTIVPAADEAGRDTAAMAEDILRHPDSYQTNVHQNMRKDGSLVWMAWTNRPICDAGGNLIEILAIGNDLTQLKQAEAALRRSEARLGLLSRTASCLLAAVDPLAVVKGLCNAVMEHLGCQAFFNFIVDEERGRLRLNAWAGISDEEARRIEWLDFGAALCGCAARDCQRIIAEDILHSTDVRADLVRSYGIQAYCCHPLVAEGRVVGTLSFGTRTRPAFSAEEVELMRTVADQVATAMERVMAREALRRANLQLVEADRRKTEFLAVLSHELRNPLAPIANSLYILDHAQPGGERSECAKQVIGRQVGQLSNLVNDLLDVTRITRNKVQLQKERIELWEVVCRAVEDHRSLFERAGVHVELAPAFRPVPVLADRTRVAQVVGNLLQNSAKFTGKGGLTRVFVAIEGNEAVVRVADNGVGIARETAVHLFHPFMQAAQSLDRSQGGLGIGLALVKGLVELHGGTVSAQSEGLGKGAEFAVRLPLDTGATLEASASAPAARARRRVLIIEDNVDAADSLSEALGLGDHEVEVAYNGPEGIAKAREFRPDVVLCDIGLPGMDGYDVARALRTEEELRGTFLVALSGYALPEDLQRAADAGFQRHLPKPPVLEKLEQLLAEAPGAASHDGSAAAGAALSGTELPDYPGISDSKP